jgi:hypothetical protein
MIEFVSNALDCQREITRERRADYDPFKAESGMVSG